MVTSIICKHVIQKANTTASKKEFLIQFALKQRPIRPLSTTKRATQLLQGSVEGSLRRSWMLAILEFYLTEHWRPVKFMSSSRLQFMLDAWLCVRCKFMYIIIIIIIIITAALICVALSSVRTLSLAHAMICLSTTGCAASCPASFVSMLNVYAFISCQINATRTNHTP